VSYNARFSCLFERFLTGEAMHLLYCILLFTTSCVLTGVLRCYALATNLIDVPNHRSSHKAPTPRGGGVAFVLCFLAAVVGLNYLSLVSTTLAIAILGAGSFIALLGFLDDHGSIPAKWRLAGHFLSAVFCLYWLGMPAIPFFGWSLVPSFFANVFGVVFLVWLLNLYNFMDGIDGVAGVEALTVCLSGALLYYLSHQTDALLLPLSLAFAVAGFLFWNFPPAKIFMGDAGSGFLGLVLGVLSIHAATINPAFFWSWLIFLGVFIVDATVTLLCRGLRGEVLSQAHRSHAYQYASRLYGNHLPVTLAILLINLVWLLPMALAVGLGFIDGFCGLVIAYLPLLILAFVFKAGRAK
jgi:Fuc2NAc and GlcNAc transferase